MVVESNPEFLDNDFFQKALIQGNNLKSVEIIDVKLSKATVSGDNYCSEIYRANVHYSSEKNKNERISLIIKAMPTLGESGKVLDDMFSYEKETEMFSRNIPEITELLGGTEDFAAKWFYSSNQEKIKLMVFEDLKALNYTMADRKALLDLNHCKLVISKIARFHATSMLKIESFKENTKYFDSFVSDNLDENIMGKFVSAAFTKLSEVVSTWPDSEEISEKFQKIAVSLKIYYV